MVRASENLAVAYRGVLGILAVALLPVFVEAAGIGFRNDTPYPIFVQGSVVVNGQLQRGPLLMIKPGQTGWDVNLTKGNRSIAIYGSANQKLFEANHDFPGKDQFFSVIPIHMPRQPLRVDLKEIPLPPGK